MRATFDTAGGSVLGANHVRLAKNNQDAFRITQTDTATVAVVTDGCGSQPHSEVGATLGAALVTTAVLRHAEHAPHDDPAFWQDVLAEVLSALRDTAIRMGGRFSTTVKEHFLFTVVGALATSDGTTVFSIGDGFVAVNGEVLPLGPFPRDEPPYLSYNFVATTLVETSFPFQLRHYAHESVEHLLLGTDGVRDLLATGETLEQFWADRMFRNHDNIRRRLAVINRETTRFSQLLPNEDGFPHVHLGVLQDDTTIITLRRRNP